MPDQRTANTSLKRVSTDRWSREQPASRVISPPLFSLLLLLLLSTTPVITGCSSSTGPESGLVVTAGACGTLSEKERPGSTFDDAYNRAAAIIEERKQIFCESCDEYELKLIPLSVEEDGSPLPDSTFSMIRFQYLNNSKIYTQNTDLVISTDGGIYDLYWCED